MGPAGFEPAACGLADKGVNPARLYFELEKFQLLSMVRLLYSIKRILLF
jgi:hypothetical protein